MDRLLRALPLPSGGLLRRSLSFLALRTKLFSYWLMPRLVITSSGKRSSDGSPELSDHESDDCAICLGKMEPGEERRELKCHHLFHKFCINKWFEQPRRSCPVCREPPVATATPKNRRGSETQDDNVFVFFPWEDCPSDAWWIR